MWRKKHSAAPQCRRGPQGACAVQHIAALSRRSRNHPRQEGSRDTQVGRSTVFHPNKRELMMLTSVRSLLAATILGGSVLAASPALAQDDGAASPITISRSEEHTSEL